jgi:hypothetical protein
MADERSIEQFVGPAEFRAWLAANHAISNGMWPKIAKKVSYPHWSVAESLAIRGAGCEVQAAHDVGAMSPLAGSSGSG